MNIIRLTRPITIARRSGWTTSFDFWSGMPPTSVADPLDGYAAIATFLPISQPDGIPFALTTDNGGITITGNSVVPILGRGEGAYWPLDDYDFMLRVYRPEDETDRYVVRNWPNASPVKVIAPPGGNTPIPGGGSNIALPLSFSQGFLPDEALPGYPLVDMVNVRGATSRFAALVKPTAAVSFAIRRNGVVIGTASMDPLTCGAGPVFTGTVTLLTDPFTFNAGDFLDWVAPATPDATFTSGAVTLAGS